MRRRVPQTDVCFSDLTQAVRLEGQARCADLRPCSLGQGVGGSSSGQQGAVEGSDVVRSWVMKVLPAAHVGVAWSPATVGGPWEEG